MNEDSMIFDEQMEEEFISEEVPTNEEQTEQSLSLRRAWIEISPG